MSAIMLASAGSGAGKTTVTLGLLAALKQRGVKVRAAKTGPDYIDPVFHTAVSGRPSFNLDRWSMPEPMLLKLMERAVADSELLVIESAMGLFDGVSTHDGTSSSPASLAIQFGIPVVIILDVSAQSQTAAAIAYGLATYKPDLKIAGVILNRVAGERHAAPIREALAQIGIPVLGIIPRDSKIVLPERHLGLVQPQENSEFEHRIESLRTLVSENVDLDSLIRSGNIVLPHSPNTMDHSGFVRPPGKRIALASDLAFSFIYPHLLQHWENSGSKVIKFSPLDNEPPADECDVCWLPGGYPDLHLERLSRATAFHEGIRKFSETKPVHGECGGYMVLGRYIEGANGTTYKMSGLLSHVTGIANRRLHLGYREARTMSDSVYGKAGTVARGHEFHYVSLLDSGHDDPFATIYDASGAEIGHTGGIRGNVSGSFFYIVSSV